MSYSKTVTLWCDKKDCLEWYSSEDPITRETRKNAKKDGWIYQNGSDLCPKCAKNLEKFSQTLTTTLQSW